MSFRLGYQIPNFTYPDTAPQQIFERVAAQAREAEASGFDTVLVMDHFYQLPNIGPAENAMLECYTTLGALASVTSSVKLSALVTGNTYRNPAMLAKIVTTLDVVSGGRAILGIGAGWYEKEHDEYGFEFGTFTERFARLDEALQIIRPMLRGEQPTVTGEWYRVRDALNNPRVRDDLPVMLGGGGEKKTFALAARYADHMNIICGLDELPGKLDALRQRCEEADRDPATLATSYYVPLFLAGDGAAVRALTSQVPEAMRGRVVAGTPDEVVEQVQERVLAHGVGGLTVSMIPNGHEPGAVAMAGEALAPLVAGS